MVITLVRHAEVEQKYKNCYNGHIDITLSEHGEQQAKELAKTIDTESYDAVYSSDLLRCRETLKYFQKDADIFYTSLLREKSWGKHEGLSFEEISAQDKIEYQNFTQWINMLDGESYQHFNHKIKYFFLRYLPKTPHQNILIVTHAGVIKTLISLVQKVTLEETFMFKTPYASIIIYDTFKQTFSRHY